MGLNDLVGGMGFVPQPNLRYYATYKRRLREGCPRDARVGGG
jgi:hypothetical protein